jgi:hypothetical protein
LRYWLACNFTTRVFMFMAEVGVKLISQMRVIRDAAAWFISDVQPLQTGGSRDRLWIDWKDQEKKITDAKNSSNAGSIENRSITCGGNISYLKISRTNRSIVNYLISYGGDIFVKEQWIDSKSIDQIHRRLPHAKILSLSRLVVNSLITNGGIISHAYNKLMLECKSATTIQRDLLVCVA